MSDTAQSGYTAPHASCAESKTFCEQCRAPFRARIRRGENRDRFCSPICRYRWHNTHRAEKRNSVAASVDAAGSGGKQKQTKIKRVFTELACGRSLNRFEAERLGDHCLHSTIAKIESRGIEVSRYKETVPGFGGHATRVCRYELDEENRKRAAALLGWRTCPGDP